MRTVKKLILLINLIFVNIIYSQELVNQVSLQNPQNRMFGSFTAGASVFGGSLGSGFNTFVMPNLGYRVTPNLTITGGIGYMDVNMNSAYFGENSGMFHGTAYILNTTALYRLNDQLTVYGSVFKTISQGPPTPNMNPQAINLNSQGVSMGMTYKFSDCLSIGIQLMQRSGCNVNPLLYPNSYFHPGMYGFP